MKILAIIPARKGSKRIKDKNLQKVGELTLIEHALGSIIGISEIEKTVITTDYTKEELAIDPRLRARHDIIAQPEELNRDFVRMEDVLKNVLKIEKNQGYDYVILLQPTSPLRTRDDVRCAIDQIQEEKWDSLFSGYSFQGLTWLYYEMSSCDPGRPWWCWYPSYNLVHRPFSQDIPPKLIENGAIYIFKPWVLEKHNARLGGKIGCYLMEPFRSVDIDTPADLEHARSIARFLYYDRNNH